MPKPTTSSHSGLERMPSVVLYAVLLMGPPLLLLLLPLELDTGGGGSGVAAR